MTNIGRPLQLEFCSCWVCSIIYGPFQISSLENNRVTYFTTNFTVHEILPENNLIKPESRKVEEAEILLLWNEEFIMTPNVNFAQSSQNLTMEQAETAG